MLDLMRNRFGGSWDGTPPEIHGLLQTAGKKLKVEVMLVEATGQWQVSVFEGGGCIAIHQSKDPIEATAHALSQCF